MTLIRCPTSYELYRTSRLASEANTVTNFGDQKQEIHGVHNSYQTGKSKHMTFIESPNTVVEVWVEYSNVTNEEVFRKEIVCKLPVDKSDPIIDVYVFNSMILARPKKNKLKLLWFMKPLSSKSFAKRLTFTQQSEFEAAKVEAGVFVGNTTSNFVHFYGASVGFINIYSF
jgi:hypothetical protein